jgi:SpoVK/Ycf46/Vps4 family AAA+-type ATPase
MAQLVLDGRLEDAFLLLRRDLPRLARHRPDLSDQIASTMARAAAQPTRRLAIPRPVDQDTKLDLVREELNPIPDAEPVWPAKISHLLQSLVEERRQLDRLAAAGISPTKTLLFIGAPGVGKTLAARWLAAATQRPLLTLDLAAVMSSFLGRTGNNIRAVLDYAKGIESVLLLDEFDAIAKRRDDTAEVGELKRLVTVLLQSVDEWPASGLLIAATNHPELLDPAVWRRFDSVIEFPLPDAQEIAILIRQHLPSDANIREDTIQHAAAIFEGQAPADIVRDLNSAKRDAVLSGTALETSLLQRTSVLVRTAPTGRRLSIAEHLQSLGLSQRDIRSLTGLSRDTLRAKGIGVRKPNRVTGS